MNVLKVYPYKGVKIYIRQWDEVFEYLFPFKGEVYQFHITLKMRKQQKTYSDEELRSATFAMMTAAEASIDDLIKKNSFFYRFKKPVPQVNGS
jgi:hypothetical protein